MYLNYGKRFNLLLFFISFSAFSFELVLTRIFSVLMWYHFASLAIGLAMLGLGAGGVFSYLLRQKVTDKTLSILIGFYLTALLTVHLCFFYLHYNPDSIVPYLSYFHQPYFQPFQRGLFFSATPSILFAISVAYCLLTFPFFLAGAIIAAIFKLMHKEAHRLYFSDMAGAAFGTVFVAIALNIFSPMNMLSLLVFLGSFILILNTRKKFIPILILIISLVTFLSGVFDKNDEIPIARGKVAKNIIWSKWNAFSRVILYPLAQEEKTNAFGQSSYYNGYVPEQWGLLVDDTGYTTVSEYIDTEEKKEFFKWNLISLPYVINKGKVLIIGPGGGKDINCAIAMGVKEKDITAVELNPLVVKAVNDILKDKTNKLYNKVNTHIKEGRSFLEKYSGKYDVLQATSVYGRIPPASGIFTFAEDNLYTLEAFKTYFSKLNDGGFLALSRFIYEQTVPKMLLLSITALKEQGLSNPETSIFLAKERGLAILIAKKGSFTKEEINALVEHCNNIGGTILYEPYGNYENLYSNLIRHQEEHSKYILPTDDRPFYYYNFTKKEFLTSMLFKNDKFEEKGVSVLKFFFYLSIFFVMLIIILPLLLTKGFMKNIFEVPLGIYFFSLGIGYIMIEIICIKSFSLFLETPIYSMIFVTGSLLLSSALGAYFSKNWLTFKSLKVVLVVLILLIFLITFTQDIVLGYLYLNLYQKVFITIIMLFVIGFFLGMPFPFVLKKVGAANESLVAWGVALNSVSSVLGSFLCLILVVNFGFKKSYILAGCFYILALLILYLIEKRYEKV